MGVSKFLIDLLPPSASSLDPKRSTVKSFFVVAGFSCFTLRHAFVQFVQNRSLTRNSLKYGRKRFKKYRSSIHWFLFSPFPFFRLTNLFCRKLRMFFHHRKEKPKSNRELRCKFVQLWNLPSSLIHFVYRRRKVRGKSVGFIIALFHWAGLKSFFRQKIHFLKLSKIKINWTRSPFPGVIPFPCWLPPVTYPFLFKSEKILSS